MKVVLKITNNSKLFHSVLPLLNVLRKHSLPLWYNVVDELVSKVTRSE